MKIGLKECTESNYKDVGSPGRAFGVTARDLLFPLRFLLPSLLAPDQDPPHREAHNKDDDDQDADVEPLRDARVAEVLREEEEEVSAEV